MSLTDPIADMLTRVRNAIKERHESVEFPTSKIKLEIIKVLKEEGFIKKYEHKVNDNKKFLKVILKYGPNNEKIIDGIDRISKPGKRVYVNKDDIPKVLNGLGISILSTNKGVMTGKNARIGNVGGELICKVW
ncbi:MAG: 30S ribosomal protein S8 [Candidatus Margulisiibacteriota bacterium]|nr:ribosomal protein S8 [uncultured bacterium]OGH99637.1 MAG: 30S ribosomal protein S8 [Candidatus Margulisbacteria bacterium GWD2_39_127]OGI04630.1 MAG: 30S ribosomal protein S8 [Candidatus Margulisbacteria bacterium GWF2_38_17]OGI11838.1 MAG: 30S ribosomal protein S8 [Candidatus Margulisbacteria bacterium GWE2_39_32]PZM79787.1 MAG: 30S ribosomal protein S8 [Candidatus Margulisiibacteriota bacterium]